MLTAVPNVKPSRLTGGGRSWLPFSAWVGEKPLVRSVLELMGHIGETRSWGCLKYTSDAADDIQSVDLGGRRIIKKK